MFYDWELLVVDCSAFSGVSPKENTEHNNDAISHDSGRVDLVFLLFLSLSLWLKTTACFLDNGFEPFEFE